MKKEKIYWVYIITNINKNVIYIGVTNDLIRRIHEHEYGINNGFSKQYNCHYLIYFEEFRSINKAIRREKELKGWRRSKKDALIHSINPQLNFLNDQVKSLYKHSDIQEKVSIKKPSS
jgi:putative endonuclease